MARVTCDVHRAAVFTSIISIVFVLSFVLSAGSLPSRASSNDVYLELVTTGNDNWTKSLTKELFNFTVNNSNVNLSIDEINITVPVAADGNASFVVNASTINASNSSWTCANANNDSVGNTSVIRCSTSAGTELNNGSVIFIWFDAQASLISGENVHQWGLLVRNITWYNFSQNLSSGVDGLAPAIQFVSSTTTQAGNRSQNYIEANVSVNESNLDTITVFLYNSSGFNSLGLVNSTQVHSSPYFFNFTNLPQGYYYMNASVNDSTAHTAQTTTTTIMLDTNIPSLIIYSPENITYNYSSGIRLNYGAGDTIGLHSCWYSLNSTSNTTLSNCANATLPALGEGRCNITVYANDTTGNLNSTIRYFTVDLTPPVITLTSPSNRAWDKDGGNVQFKFIPVDSYSDPDVCTLWLTNDNATGWNRDSVNESPTNNTEITVASTASLTNSTDENGTYYWNVECNDSVGWSAFASQNFTLYVGNRSNLMIFDIDWTKNPTPYSGMNITLNITVKNNGSGDVVNDTLVKMCFGTGADPCSSGPIIINTTTSVPSAFLTSGNQYSIYYTVPLNQSYGRYYIRAEADHTNNETIEQYPYDNARTEYLSTYLNVTILGITHYNNVIGPKPGTNVTLNVSVKYDNGTGADSLQFGDFTTIEDKWANASSPSYTNKTTSLFSHNLTSEKSNGIYYLNYTVPNVSNGYAEYDLHYLKITAKDNNTAGQYHDGTSEESASGSYHLLAPSLTILSMSDFEMDQGDTEIKTYTFTNNGNDNFTQKINLTRYPTSGGLSVTLGDNDITKLEAGESESIQVTYIGSTIGSYTVWINASTIHDVKYYWYNKTIIVQVANASSEPPPEDGDGETPPTPCIINASCSGTQWCKNGACVALSCPSGYYASDHICKLQPVFNVDIYEFKKALYVTQGDTLSTSISVKNTGNYNFTAMLAVELVVTGVNFSVTPSSQSIGVNEKKNFTIEFNVARNTTIGNYTARYQLTTNTVAKDLETITIVILPLPETMEKLRVDLQNSTQLVEQLIAEFNSIKASGTVTGQNMTILEAKVNATKKLLDDAKDAINRGDYIKLAQLLNDINVFVASTRKFMQEIGTTQGGGLGPLVMWIVVGLVCVGAVGLLIYMLVPPKGYTLGKGYSPHGRASILHSITNKLRKMKPTKTGGEAARKYTPAYTGGYQKVEAAYAPAAKMGFVSKLNKLKKIFKRK